MSAIARALGFLVCLFLIATPASANGPRWACWYALGSETVRCVLERAPEDDAGTRLAAYDRIADPRHPALLRTIRGRPEMLSGRQITIPLWTPPLEMDFVRELAESVMCGTQRDCSVHFDANTDGRAGLRAASRIVEQLDGERLFAFSREVLDGEMLDGGPAETPAAIAAPAPERRSLRRRSGFAS